MHSSIIDNVKGFCLLCLSDTESYSHQRGQICANCLQNESNAHRERAKHHNFLRTHFTSVCSDAPLSSWHRAAVPCRDTTTDLRHVFTSSSSVCRNADSGRSFDPSFNTWRPSVSGGCRTRLELSAVLVASSPVTDDVQALPESRTVRVLFHLGLNCLTALSTRLF